MESMNDTSSEERDGSGYDPEALLSYWYEDQTRWFTSGAHQKAVDLYIHDRWGEAVQQASSPTESGKMMWVIEWRQSASGSLALIILLDQFARHVERHRRLLLSNGEVTMGSALEVDTCSAYARSEALTQWKGLRELVDGQVIFSDQNASSTADAMGVFRSETARFDPEQLTTAELVFLLMPFRHGIDIAIKEKQLARIDGPLNDRRAHLRVVLNLLDSRESKIQESINLIKRFRKQTQRSLNTADDAAKAPAAQPKSKVKPANSQMEERASENVNAPGDDQGILDASVYCKDEIDDGADILERMPFDADETLLQEGNHLLLQTLDSFLSKFFDQKLKSRETEERNLNEGELPLPPPVLALSLSGGVDSMVLLKLLSCNWLRERHGNYVVLSLHVNYGNRGEATREADYVRRYALASHQGALFEVLELGGGRNERSRMSRDEYERVSRQRRFAWYRACLQKHCAGIAERSSEISSIPGANAPASIACQHVTGVGIMLAHHLGDVEENVLSNVMHGNLPDALSGMRETGTVEGCMVWRPLLPHRKDIIYEFAHTYGVPYFLDSTPSWSTRYAIRRRLLPLIREIYGDGAHRNLASLAANSDALHDEVEQTLLAPFLHKNTVSGPLGVAVHGACAAAGFSPKVKHQNFGAQAIDQSGASLAVNDTEVMARRSAYWWRMVLMSVLHSIGNPMLSDKSLQVLLCRLRDEQPPRKGRRDHKKAGNRSRNDRCHRGKPQHSKDSTQLPEEKEASLTLFPKDGWLELRKEWPAYLQQGTLFLFKTKIFLPLRSADSRARSAADNGDVLILPLPPLQSIMSQDWASGRGQRISGESIQLGGWTVRCVAVPSYEYDQRPNVVTENKDMVHLRDDRGLVETGVDAASWIEEASTYQKQADHLPLTKFPVLDAQILGGLKKLGDRDSIETMNNGPVDNDSASGCKRTKLKCAPEPDFLKLLGGKFSYTILMPIRKIKSTGLQTNGKAEAFTVQDCDSHLYSWERYLILQQAAKLLPLRQLDKCLRDLLPLFSPSQKMEAEAMQCCTPSIAYKEHFCCLLDIQINFSA